MLKVHCLKTVATLLLGSALSVPSYADSYPDYGMKSPRDLRLQSLHRADRHLGYRSVIPPYYYQPRRDIDFDQTSRLVDRIASRQRAIPSAPASAAQGFIPELPGDPFVSQQDAGGFIQRTYGRGGPSKESVRLITEYRLHIIGNPNIKLGEISEDENSVMVNIVTRNGDLVERYQVNKISGLWNAVR
jgi:hypothetical protein